MCRYGSMVEVVIINNLEGFAIALETSSLYEQLG
jgi:hypothetical protein